MGRKFDEINSELNQVRFYSSDAVVFFALIKYLEERADISALKLVIKIIYIFFIVEINYFSGFLIVKFTMARFCGFVNVWNCSLYIQFDF